MKLSTWVRRRHPILYILLFILIPLIWVTLNQDGLKKVEESQPGLYSIKQFVDGDTIVVNMNSYAETIRMIGVDTPETHRPNTPVQCYGPEAAAYTKQLIGANKVRLQADPLDTNRDRYGRLLRYIYLPNGILVEAKLISGGYGFAYTSFPFEKKESFKALETQARDAGQGLWSACKVIVQDNGIRQTNPAN